MLSPQTIRALLAAEAFRWDDASAAIRQAVSCWLDDEGLRVRAAFPDLASYMFGLADSLRRPSRSRRERPQLVN